jgi:hypothetical protein
MARQTIITITEIMANLPQTEFPFNLPRQSSNFFFTTVPPPYQKYQLLHRLTLHSV